MSPPASPWQAAPGQPGQPGGPAWGTGGGYGGGFGGPPPTRRTGLIVGGIVLAVVLIAGLAVGAIAVFGGDDDKATSASSTTSADPTASETADPTPTPTAAAPSVTAPSVTAPSAAAPTTPPPADPTPADRNPGHLDTSDFPGDWHFKLGGTKLDATLERSKDYSTCSPVATSRLVGFGCRYAVSWTFHARGGKLKMTEIIYVMKSEKAAKTAADKLKQDDLRVPDGATIPDFADGVWRASPYGKAVVVSLVTTAKGVPSKTASKYLAYGNTDFGSALYFMSL